LRTIYPQNAKLMGHRIQQNSIEL